MLTFKSGISLFVLILPFAPLAQATIEIVPPISVSSGVPAWRAKFSSKVETLKAAKTYPANGYTECRETKEIPNTYLCIYNTQKGMNSGLGRSSFFIEGTGGPQTKGKVVPQDDPTYEGMKLRIGGHDLKGVELLVFDQAVQRECSANGEKFCHNIYEEDIFANLIRPKTAKDKAFVVIAFGNESRMKWEDVVTHEILHAQYFNDSRYRDIADRFWDSEMSAAEKEEVRSSLASYYDRHDELLMKNEFQAYMLMAGAESSQLGRLVSKYRPQLLKRLQEAGITPVQVGGKTVSSN